MLLVGVGVMLAALSFVNSQPPDADDERKRQVYREMFDDSSAKKNWKNPYDMFGNEENPLSEETTNVVDEELSVKDEVPREEKDERLNPTEKKTDESPRPMGEESETKTCVATDIVFLTRWLKIVHAKLSQQSFFDVGDSKIVSFKVTRSTVVRMKKILDADSVNFKDMEDLITDSLSDLWVVNEVSWLSKFYDVAFVLSETVVIPAFALILFIYLLGSSSVVKKIAVVFVCACVWNWLRLYKEAVAAQHARLERTDVAAACYQKNFWISSSIKAYIKSWIYDSGDCNEYYKSLMVDPIFNVDPSKAVVDTMCNIVLIPLERTGYYMNRFLKNLLFELPLEGKIMAVVIFIIILMLLFNYTIRLPWFLGVIEPSRNSRNIIGSLSRLSNIAYGSEERPVQCITRNGSNEVSMHESQLNQINKSSHDSCDLITFENEDSQSDLSISYTQNPDKSIKMIGNSNDIPPIVSLKPEDKIVTSTRNSSEVKNEGGLVAMSTSKLLSATAEHRKTVLRESASTHNDNECLSEHFISCESNQDENLPIINKVYNDVSVVNDEQLKKLLKVCEE